MTIATFVLEPFIDDDPSNVFLLAVDIPNIQRPVSFHDRRPLLELVLLSTVLLEVQLLLLF